MEIDFKKNIAWHAFPAGVLSGAPTMGQRTRQRRKMAANDWTL
jgi:hypothetical protein